MLVAQITDLHIGTGDDIGAEDNYVRLLSVFDRIKAMRRQPDLIIATGDLTETGSVAAYTLLKQMIDESGLSILPCLGNHDKTANFRRVFGGRYLSGEFCQYSYDAGPFRLIVADTHDETIHGGIFCEARAAWLDKALKSANGAPVLLALHHPPVVSGIDWMGARSEDEGWIEQINAVVSKYPNVSKAIAGHIHRPISQMFGRVPCATSAATAAQVYLELAPINASTADGRPLIVDEPPAFALHEWDGKAFTSHHGLAGNYEVILEYHARFRDVMRDVFHVPE